MDRCNSQKRYVAIAVMCCAVASGVACGDIIYVDLDAPGANDGTSWENAFVDLQGALGVAQDGDEIHVADGVYAPAGPGGSRDASFDLVSGVAMLGGYAGWGAADPDDRDPDEHPSTLSGDINFDDQPDGGKEDNSYHVVEAYMANSDTVIDGFTIAGGHADGENAGNRHCGAGILILGGEPQVSNCSFEKNFAHAGGGLANIASRVTVTGCDFLNNEVERGGGAMVNIASHTTTEDCTFYKNTAGDGGAVTNGHGSDSVFKDCRFIGNTVWEWRSGGGAMETGELCKLRIEDCFFEENWAERSGGALLNYECDVVVVGSRFTGNIAENEWEGRGGGIYSRGGTTTCLSCRFQGNSSGDAGGAVSCVWYGHLRVVGCVVAGNESERGGGIYSMCQRGDIISSLVCGNRADSGGGICTGTGDISIANCTVVGNTSGWGEGGGLDVGGGGTKVYNSIFWLNSRHGEVEERYQIDDYRGMAQIQGTCIQGWSGTRWSGDNFGDDPLMIDPAGVDGVFGTGDDDPRLGPGSPCINRGYNDLLWRDAIDVDADGNTEEIYPFDIAMRSRLGDGIVDCGSHETVGDCNDNGIPDDMDIINSTSADCNGNLIPDECLHIEEDCNGNHNPDECDLAEGASEDCSGNHIPDECEADCNQNGVADSCDILNSTSGDCNLDGVPDECGGDCDGNGEWDVCEVYSGDRPDVNENMIPDECEDLGGLSRLYVHEGATGLNNGSSWENALLELRSAFRLAHEYPEVAEIWVAGGTYETTRDPDDHAAAFVFRDNLMLVGGFAGWEESIEQRVAGNPPAILTGDVLGDDWPMSHWKVWEHPTRSDNAYHTVIIADCLEQITIDGVTIEGGVAREGISHIDKAGGGILIDDSAVNLIGAVVRGCAAETLGGGIYMMGDSSLAIEESRIVSNSALSGGGIHCPEEGVVSISDSIIAGNTGANDGGGIWSRSRRLSLANTMFAENKSGLSSWDGRGGAVYLYYGVDLEFLGCIFSGNASRNGSALYIRGTDPAISNCTFSFNKSLHDNEVIPCIEMLSAGAEPLITNSIIWGNTGQDWDPIVGGSPTVLHSCIQGGWPGEGNIDTYARFRDPLGIDGIAGTEDDDLRLMPDSPCIDAGSIDLLPADMLDLDGDGNVDELLPVDFDFMPRVLGESVDMGAFEYWVDVDGNGIPDECDLTCEGGCDIYPECGSYHDCNDDGVADEYCVGDFDFNGAVELGDVNLLKASLSCDVEALPYCECGKFDLDSNGDVGAGDINIVKSMYGPCGP